MGFIEKYLELNEGTEVPDIFAMWSGVFGISAVVGRSVFVRLGYITKYPNLMVVFVAQSGTCRKSTAIDVITGMLYNLPSPPNIISQKITTEALIKAMKPKTKSSDKKDNLFDDGESLGICIASEMSAFLNKNSYEAGLGPTLIELYDCRHPFKYETLSRGVEYLPNPCLGMLAGTTIDWIRSSIPREAVGGGLTSRIIFVYVGEPAKPVPFPPPVNEKLLEELRMELLRIQSLQGPITWSPEAQKMYEEEYLKFRSESDLQHNATLMGYASRRFDHILKLATILSVSESSRMVLEPKHYKAATLMLQRSEIHMPLVLSKVTASNEGSAIEEIRTAIKVGMNGSPGRIDRRVLLQKFSHQMNSRQLTEIVETLSHSGQIKQENFGGMIIYTYLGGFGK